MLNELHEVLELWRQAEERVAESRMLRESLLAGKRPKRIPILPNSNDEDLYLPELRITMGEYRSDPEIALKTALRALSWRLREFPEEDVTEISASIITECNSIVASAFCEVRQYPDRVGYMTVPRLESIKDVGKLKVPNPDEIPAVRRISRFAEYFLKHIRDRIPINIPVPIMPSTNAAMIRGETEFMYDLIDHPKEAKQLLEIAVETEVRVVKHFRELLGCSEPETIGLADDAVCYFSPQLYEEFAVPYERIAIEALSKTGKARSFHICGPSMHLLEIIKKHLDPQEMLISHLGNVTNASEVMPGTILRGNADPQVLKDGPRDKIRDHILECLSQGETCDLYCFASGTDSWYRDTPIENMHYAYAVIKEYEHQAGRHE